MWRRRLLRRKSSAAAAAMIADTGRRCFLPIKDGMPFVFCRVSRSPASKWDVPFGKSKECKNSLG